MLGTRTALRLIAAALAALLSGCLSIKDPMHHEDNFNEHMRTFTQYVRWGNWGGAAGYLVEEQRDAFLELAPELADVRFTDYEILRQDLNDERTEATVEVALTGYRLSSPVSRTMRLSQKWTRVNRSDWQVRVELDPVRAALGLAAK